MKLSFYFDLWPGTKASDTIYASTRADVKPIHTTRYRIDVEIKDPADPDEVINTKAITEEKINE